jgi:hypothetical protein
LESFKRAGAARSRIIFVEPEPKCIVTPDPAPSLIFSISKF